MHKSSVAKRVLKKYCNQLEYKVATLVSSVATCWNSVLFMIERIISIRHAVALTLVDAECRAKGAHLLPTDDDYKLMEQMTVVLKIFHTITQPICGEKYATVNLVIPFIERIKNHLGST